MAGFDASSLTRPGTDPSIARNTQRTQDIMLAQVAGQAKPGGAAGTPPPSSTDMSQAAAGTTSAIGGQVLKQVAGEVAAAKGGAQNVAATSAAAAQDTLGQARLARQAKATQNEAALTSLDASSKKKLLDDRIAFQTDVTGQTQLQTSQMLDWAVGKAQNQQQLATYTQQIGDATQKAEATAKAGYDAMTATLEAASKGQIQGMDEATKMQITQAQATFKLQYAQTAAKAAAQMQMFTAAGTIIGGAGGAVVAGPAGAVGGAAVGGGVGTAVGSATQ